MLVIIASLCIFGGLGYLFEVGLANLLRLFLPNVPPKNTYQSMRKGGVFLMIGVVMLLFLFSVSV